MDRNSKYIPDTQMLTRLVGACVGVVILVLEGIICAEFISLSPRPATWMIACLVSFCLVLDVLCFVEFMWIKSLKARIVVYCFDFLGLLFICCITGSPYLSGLYCVILSQLYTNVEEFKTKIVALVSSAVMFILTCVAGWFINRIGSVMGATATELLSLISSCVVGLIVIGLHFIIVNFLLSFYRNNKKLHKALDEADASKRELEEAYNRLSETAVFRERNRIARDIHDNAGHSMTAVIMQTEAAKLIIDTDPEEAKNKIISANIQAKIALEQMRDSVHLLAGRETAISLKEELEEIMAQTMDGTEVKIRFDIADISLSPSRRRFITNSLKECLSNGMRHGGASAFYVELAEESGWVTLTVSDNGSGLPDDFKEGFGIRGIREKAVGFGGGIVFESEPDDGCEIRIKIKSDDGDGGD